ATMFSVATPRRFSAPRPPTPIMAMLSFSLRFRPRTKAGAASAPMAVLATTRPNRRRVDRPELAEDAMSLMEGPPRVTHWTTRTSQGGLSPAKPLPETLSQCEAGGELPAVRREALTGYARPPVDHSGDLRLLTARTDLTMRAWTSCNKDVV